MGICSDQPLAKSRGVHREVESEGGWRQNSDPGNTNTIRHRDMGEANCADCLADYIEEMHWIEDMCSKCGGTFRRDNAKCSQCGQPSKKINLPLNKEMEFVIQIRTVYLPACIIENFGDAKAITCISE